MSRSLELFLPRLASIEESTVNSWIKMEGSEDDHFGERGIGVFDKGMTKP